MDLIKSISETEIIYEKVDKVEVLYKDKFPQFIRKMISYMDDVVFLDNSYRVLSYDEVINAENDLHVNFIEKGILPLIDCGENDFISYGTKDGLWFKFNIVDVVNFQERERRG